MPQIQARRKTRNIYIHAVDQPVATPAYKPHITLTDVAQRRRLPTRVVHVYSIPPPISAPPHGKILVQNAPPRKRYTPETFYRHAQPPAAASPPDYKPRITTQEAPYRARRLPHSIYLRAAPTPPDYAPRVLVQRAPQPGRKLRKVAYTKATFTAAPQPDYRPRILVQLAPRARRRPGASIHVSGLPVVLPATGWRRPFIQTARRVRRGATRILIARILRFTPGAIVGASPPRTRATRSAGPSRRTRVEPFPPDTSIDLGSHPTMSTGDDGQTYTEGVDGRIE